MTPKIEIFGQNFCSFWRFWGVIFDHFGGQKSRFLDFFEVASELFRMSLGIVFDLILFAIHNWRSPLGSCGSPKPRKIRRILIYFWIVWALLILFATRNWVSPLGSRGSPNKSREGFPQGFIGFKILSPLRHMKKKSFIVWVGWGWVVRIYLWIFLCV